ncbi:MAG: phosphatidate cytidylyltransferase [Sediminibacterium sp.]|jgi:phosphatidate cytidylyltransferase
MAFNFSVFKVRALSAIVFVLIMLAGLLFNSWSYFALFLLIQIGCLYEYQKLMRIIFPSYQQISKMHQWGVLVVGLFMMTSLAPTDIILPAAILQKLPPAYQGIGLRWIGLKAMPVALVLMLVADVFTRKADIRNISISFFGFIYISISLSLFYAMRGMFLNSAMSMFFPNIELMVPILVIVTVWVNDTMAYIVGSFIGRTPISPISPKKTWEGTIAGVILSVVILSTVAGQFIPISTKYLYMITIVASVMGNLGDLFESKLKRLAGVKDSGSMMPGHGGFLDRFDSILFAGPFVWILLQFIF